MSGPGDVPGTIGWMMVSGGFVSVAADICRHVRA